MENSSPYDGGSVCCIKGAGCGTKRRAGTALRPRRDGAAPSVRLRSRYQTDWNRWVLICGRFGKGGTPFSVDRPTSERAAIRQVRMRWDGTVTDSLTLHCTRARLFPSVCGYAPHLAGQWRDTPHALAIGFHVGAVHPPVHRAVAGQRPQRGAAVGGGIVAARKQGRGLRRKGQKEQRQHQQSTHIVSFPGGIPGYTGSFYQKRPEEYRNPSQEGAVGRSGRGAEQGVSSPDRAEAQHHVKGYVQRGQGCIAGAIEQKRVEREGRKRGKAP